MSAWGKQGVTDRGVSHVLGVVLLASVVVIGAFLIVQVGQQTLGDVNNEANVEIAEEVMLSVDNSFQRSETDESVVVPNRVRSDVGVRVNATYNLTLNGSPSCSTGNRTLHTIEYQRDGKRVGYEGGGVWRQTESGATMSAPPAVTYDDGSLSLSFANISGRHIGGESVTVRSNATSKRSHEAALKMAMFTDATYEQARSGAVTSPSQSCIPSRIENATLTVDNSTYARAWADWARDTYDDKYVTVTPKAVEPGDTVRIRFALGDVSDSRYEVENLSVTPNDAGPGANVSATVTNVGGLRDTQNVTLAHNRSGSPSVNRSVTLGGGDSATVNATLPVTVSAPHNFSVSTSADAANVTVVYTSPGGSPNLAITDNTMPASARLNQVPSATVTVNNTGAMTATQRVEFLVNGSVNATRAVTVHPNDNRTLDFGPSLPTGENGTYNLTVVTNDSSYIQHRDDGHHFVVGRVGVFEITSITPPGGLQSGDPATVDATIENTGDIRKISPVEVRIVNASTGTVIATQTTTLDLDGAQSGAESGTVSVTSSPITVSEPTHYRYVVETPDRTESGSFVVGASPPPLFEITATDVKNPVRPGNQTTTTFTVRNTGGTEGEQTLRVERNGTTVVSETEALDPGESVTLNRTVTAPDEPGKYPLTFSTANRSRRLTMNVQPESLIGGNGSTITIEQSVNASVALKGADLEGFDTRYDHITHAPVQMSLYVRDESGAETIELWRDYENGDVNGPHAEQRLVSDDHENPYTYSASFEPGTEISVFAQSYYCDWSRETDPPIWLAGYETEYCSGWGDERIEVSQTQNSGNLVILGDGDELPSFEQAQWYQRDVQDTLGSRVDDTGHLRLADGERAFLYELSEPNADPDNAGREGDPDYNDAVVLFTVNAIEKDVRTGPKYRISDVDAPARVDETTDAVVTAEVTNVGGQAGTATVETTFDGSTAGNESVVIEANETEEVTFELDTDSKVPENSYGYNVTVGGSDERWSGNVYVGELDEQFMQVDSLRVPGAIDSDDSATATVTVTNVGDEAGTDTVVLKAKNDDDASPSFTTVDSVTMSTILAPGDTRQFTLDLPTDRGNYTVKVETANSTSPGQSFFVGRSDVAVADTQSINIGAQTYNTSELIERRGGASRMTVEVVNRGTIGDERTVNLTIRNESDGETVFAASKNVTAGSGDLTGVSAYPAWAGYDVDLDPGYYTYEVTVYNETTGDPVDDTASGELFLKELDETGASGDNAPISVDSDSVTLGE
ncbi:DUF7289 family protein [Haloarcula salina]|uniref:DUF7289 family protein n=1 Tax=Haloarcula salina TaxID=1429914 RepID=UPI003C6EE966